MHIRRVCKKLEHRLPVHDHNLQLGKIFSTKRVAADVSYGRGIHTYNVHPEMHLKRKGLHSTNPTKSDENQAGARAAIGSSYKRTRFAEGYVLVECAYVDDQGNFQSVLAHMNTCGRQLWPDGAHCRGGRYKVGALHRGITP